MAAITDFRTTLAAQLQTELGIDVVSGYAEGPSDTDIGCVYPIREGENPDAVQEQLVEVGVRVFKRYDRSEAPELLLDPEPLESMAATLVDALKAIQVTAGPWFFRVTEIVYDLDFYRVDALVTAWQANQFDLLETG